MSPSHLLLHKSCLFGVQELLAESHSCLTGAEEASRNPAGVFFYGRSLKEKLPSEVRMKAAFHSFVCCCLLASAAHCVDLEVKPELKKRLSIWLGSRLRRDLESAAVERMAESESFVRPEDIRDTLLPHSGSDTTRRSKRSANQSRWQGCSLSTCALHDLAHRLHEIRNIAKNGSAPTKKISPQGYGRRRRSVPERQARPGQGELRAAWGRNRSQVHKLEALLRRT